MESYLCREDAPSKESFFLSRKQCVSSVFFSAAHHKCKLVIFVRL